MGEALISRTSTIPDEVLNPINPVEGYCVLVPTIFDSSGKPIESCKVTCIDGDRTFTYNTNSKGKVLFTVNSGSVNLFINNSYANNSIMLDQRSAWYNQTEAAIGTVSNQNFTLEYQGSVNVTKNGNYAFVVTNFISGVIAGAGGGGGGWNKAYDSEYGWMYGNGGRGGSGGSPTLNNFAVSKNATYRFIIGSGGYAGSDNYNVGGFPRGASAGGSGGTTTAFNRSATGGGGGPVCYLSPWSTPTVGSGTSYGSGGYGGAGGTQSQGSTISQAQPGGSGYVSLTFKN